MLLYLVRHGKAEQGGDDESRRLTDSGRRAVERVAKTLADAGVQVSRIEHSGLARAAETAEIFARVLHGQAVQAAGLRPLSDIEVAARRVWAADGESLMLVGHSPFMNRLSAYLLTGDADLDLLHVRTGSVACLSRSPGRWTMEWFLCPALS